MAYIYLYTWNMKQMWKQWNETQWIKGSHSRCSWWPPSLDWRVSPPQQYFVLQSVGRITEGQVYMATTTGSTYVVLSLAMTTAMASSRGLPYLKEIEPAKWVDLKKGGFKNINLSSFLIWVFLSNPTKPEHDLAQPNRVSSKKYNAKVWAQYKLALWIPILDN